MTFPQLAATLLTLVLATHAGAVEYSARGIHRFTSESGCPIGARNDDAAMQCNRIAFDDNFVRADLYVKQRSIHFSNLPGADAKPRIAGDVLLHGVAKAANGKTVPVSLLITLHVANGAWRAEARAQAPVEGPLRDVRIDPFHITTTTAGATQVLFTPEQGLKALAAPSLNAAQASPALRLLDNRSGQKQPAGAKLADLTLLLGAKPALRARLEVKGSARAENLPDTLLRGDWTVELQALGEPLPLDVIQRELFLTGLEGEPLLTALRLKGFKKDSKLVVGVQGLRGFVRLDGKEVEFDPAGRAGQTFLQDSFLGLALTWQVIQP